jgi:hypothetical protein
MKKLVRATLTAGLALMLAGLLAVLAVAASTPPAAGGSYPAGTTFPGVCVENLTNPNYASTSVYEIYSTSSHTWVTNSDWMGPSTRGCEATLREPGLWRLRIDGPEESVSYGPEFRIVAATPCDNDETEIANVTTTNGGLTHLTTLIGEHFTANQTITFDNDVEIELGDKTLIRATKGSEIKMEGCSLFKNEPTKPRLEFRLLLDKIWSRVCSVLNEKCMHEEIRTERVVAGNRGTTFWMNFAHGVTTVHVDQGSMVLNPVRGKGKWKQVIVTAGHTATQRGTRAPVVRRAPINSHPPF